MQYAMAVYLRGMNTVEQSKLLDSHKISEVFGDQLIPLQINNTSSDYATCFI
jgi:hypothetical protein